MIRPEKQRESMTERYQGMGTIYHREVNSQREKDYGIIRILNQEDMKMKRVLALLTAAVLMMLCVTVQAESPLAKYYNAIENLLFYTDNVTVNVSAEFTLDGEWFKTAEADLAQDRDRSCRQLHLHSPKADGTQRYNGWSIMTEGEKLYLIEFYRPDVYRTGLTHEHTSLMRRTIETEPLVRMGKLLSENAGELLLDPDRMTEKDGKELTIRLEGESSYLTDAMLNLFWQFAARRWFSMNYDGIETDNGISMSPFITVTQALLWCTKSMELLSADVTVRLDDSGRFSEMNGVVTIGVETLSDGTKQLQMKINAIAFDYGTTMVGRFDPKDFNVTLAEDAVNIDDESW